MDDHVRAAISGPPVSRTSAAKPATAARIYDYYLGGIHNFPADQEAARQVIAHYPFIPAAARANRAFLQRAVQYLIAAGIRQFLDIGSGIPTEGNVHEIAQRADAQSRIVYVDIDPVAVAESRQLLDGNPLATAIHGDLRRPQAILDHPAVRGLLDFTQPVGLLLAAVLHFVPDDAQAHDAVAALRDAIAPGSYLVVSHSAAETFSAFTRRNPPTEDVYRQRTATPGTVRTRAEVLRFFDQLELVEPGVTGVLRWRADDGAAGPFPIPSQPATTETHDAGGMWVGVALKR
jgi:SAM-dependent methyltransferase